MDFDFDLDMDHDARTPSFGRAVSDAARFAHGSRGECEDNQCAEEGLDPEECGDDRRGPIEGENLACGMDKRPLLPLALGGSTCVSAYTIHHLHATLWGEMTGDMIGPSLLFVPTYTMVLVSMAFTALSDPGQVSSEYGGQDALPQRAHKAWLYNSPIRRYDHYCRWVMNVIGLLNHRAFVMMCGGLMLATSAGGLMDVPLIFFTAYKSAGRDCWMLLFHFGYCLTVLFLLGPICWLHIGFVSRNELANEWKNNNNYVAFSKKAGMHVPVNDLSDDEFNDSFEHFEYDGSRNIWDRGLYSNCWAFWFTPRHGVHQLGEF